MTAPARITQDNRSVQSAAEKAAYAKGYAAGQRRADRQQRTLESFDRENAMWREVFLCTLNATIVNGNWQTGKKQWSTMDDYLTGAARFADQAIKKHGWRA